MPLSPSLVPVHISVPISPNIKMKSKGMCSSIIVETSLVWYWKEALSDHNLHNDTAYLIKTFLCAYKGKKYYITVLFLGVGGGGGGGLSYVIGRNLKLGWGVLDTSQIKFDNDKRHIDGLHHVLWFTPTVTTDDKIIE